MAPNNTSTAVLDTYQAVVSAFCEFLTVAVHTILYERNIYPRTSFLNARKYNYPVCQNRHPKVCKWIQDAVAAVEVELLKGTVQQTSLIIYSPATIPLERFIFSTINFPRVPANEILTTFEPAPPRSPSSSPPPEPTTPSKLPLDEPPSSPPPTGPPPVVTDPSPNLQTPLIDLTAQFPPVIARLSTLSSILSPLPPNCTFTLAIELRETPPGAHEAPIGWPQPWVPAVPGLQHRDSKAKTADEAESSDSGAPVTSEEPSTASGGKEIKGRGQGDSEGLGEKSDKAGEKPYQSQKGKYLGGVKTTPVRSVEAGPFVMEMWVEEGVDKAEVLAAARQEAGSSGETG